MDVLYNEIIKTIPRDKTERVIGQSPALFHPYRRLSFDVTSVVSNESEASNVSTNRNDGAEGLTCCREPTAIAPQHDAPPISCFCFALWILKVNNAITTVSTVWNGSLRTCHRWCVIRFRFRMIHSVCVMCPIWASLPRTFLSTKSVSVALGVGEQSRVRRVPAGIDPGPKASDLVQREESEFGGPDGVPGRSGRSRSAPRIHLCLI